MQFDEVLMDFTESNLNIHAGKSANVNKDPSSLVNLSLESNFYLSWKTFFIMAKLQKGRLASSFQLLKNFFIMTKLLFFN